MTLSIVITTHDRKKELEECIRSIKDSDMANIDFELIVVDDASSDSTKMLRSEELNLPNSKIIHLKDKVMMAASRNIGARESKGEFVLFIDDDNEIDKKMIKVLVAFIKKNSEYGIIGPGGYYFETRKRYLDYQTINLCSGRTRGIVSVEKREVFESDGIPNVFLIRKTVFEKCGYFDEALIQTFTEPDFAMRIKKDGFKCGVVPEAMTFHKVQKVDNYKPRGLGGKFSQKAYCLMRNRTVYISRYGNILNKVVYIILFSWFWPAIYSAFALIYGRADLFKIYWKGFADGIIYFFTRKLRNSLGVI